VGQRHHPQEERALPVGRPWAFFPQAAALQMGVLSTATQVILGQRAAYQGLEPAICHHRPEKITRRLVPCCCYPASTWCAPTTT
jgi:hypothetical protein